MTCHCGGDIDDILFGDETEEAWLCSHCDGKEFDDDDRYDLIADDYGCEFPGKCLMAGPHLRSECHTVEMVRDFENEQKGPTQ